MRGRTALFVPARWKGGGLKENCSSCSCSSCSSCSCSCSCSSAPARLKNKNEGGRRPASDPPATRQRLASDLPVTRGLASGDFFSPRFARTEGYALSGDRKRGNFLRASRGLKDIH